MSSSTNMGEVYTNGESSEYNSRGNLIKHRTKPTQREKELGRMPGTLPELAEDFNGAYTGPYPAGPVRKSKRKLRRVLKKARNSKKVTNVRVAYGSLEATRLAKSFKGYTIGNLKKRIKDVEAAIKKINDAMQGMGKIGLKRRDMGGLREVLKTLRTEIDVLKTLIKKA